MMTWFIKYKMCRHGIWVKTSKTHKLVWLHSCSHCVGEAQKEDSWGLLVSQSTASSKKQDGKQWRRHLIWTSTLHKHVHTHVHATVHIHWENLYAYYSWADSLYKDSGWTRRGCRLGNRAGLGSIQALLFVVWEVRIWNQVHLLTSRTQLFVCKMVPSCQTQWDNVRGHLRVPHIMNFLLRYVVKENY